MRAARRVVFEGLGWLLIVGGVAALILPGPGLLMLFAGLAILSQQYEWAERRLDPIKYRALKGAAESVENVARIVVSILGVCFLVACGVLWILKPPPPDWWPLPDSLWLIGGAGTGSTLIASALIASALLVYSYRRFHGKPEAVQALERQVQEADQEYAELQED